MAEIKNTFLKSKMNKDLDGRLIPNGEYRDAENVAVNRSEGSDVGALENVKGNELLSSFGIAGVNTDCIGKYVDSGLNRVYLFFTDHNSSTVAPLTAYCSIMCYYHDTNTFDVLVRGSFLNFSKTKPIYGVNLLEDLLFWTDNRNQPRKINVESAITSPATSGNPYYDIEETISVAKYYPFEPSEFKHTIEIDVSITTISDYQPVAPNTGHTSVVTFTPSDIPSDYLLHPGLQFYIKTLGSGSIVTPEFPYFYQLKRFPRVDFFSETLITTDVTNNYNLTPKPSGDSGYFDTTNDYVVNDFTTYTDGKIYKAISPQTAPSLPPPDISLWEEVPSTFDYDKFETSIPILNGLSGDYTGTATIVLVYPEIENATERWLPPSYRLRMSDAYYASNIGQSLPGFIESQGQTTLANQLPHLQQATGNIIFGGGGGNVPPGTVVPVALQKPIGDIIFKISLTGDQAPNGWGLGVGQVTTNINKKRAFVKSFLFPGMRVNSPWFSDDDTFVIDQIFTNGFSSGNAVFSITIRKIDENGDGIDNWKTEFIDNSTGDKMYLSFSYKNPNYDKDFSGDEFFLKDKFARLSYRYKFDDGEYSLIAPFSQNIFIPKDYGYFHQSDEWWDSRMLGSYSSFNGFLAGDDPTTKDEFIDLGSTGVNRLMENIVNKVNLRIPMPRLGGSKVEVGQLRDLLKINKVDIILKDDNSAAMTVIKTIDTNDTSFVGNTSKSYKYTYNGEKPIRTLPEKEVVRVYDKVPIKALAQETSGNRIIYGNFLDKHTSPISLDYSVGVSRKLKSNDTKTTFSSIKYPNHSIKQNRTYQVGIVLADKFGRQSDVITNPLASTTVNDSDSKPLRVTSIPSIDITQQVIGSFDTPPLNILKDVELKLDNINYTGGSGSGARFTVILKEDPLVPGTTNTCAINVIGGGEGYKDGDIIELIVPTATTNPQITINANSLQSLTLVGDTVENPYLSISEGGSCLKTFQYLDPDFTTTVGLIPEIDTTGGRNTVDWVGDSIKLVFNEAIPATGDIGYPGLYNKDTNPLGWYSYKIVVKQQEQEYYNIYVAGIQNGEPYVATLGGDLNPNFNNLATFPLIGDNINKVTIDYDNFNIGDSVKFYQSKLKLYPRISPRGGNFYDTTTGWTTNLSSNVQKQVYNAGSYEKVVFLGNLDDIYPTDAREATSFTINTKAVYKQNSNPFTCVITNDADIGNVILTDAKDYRNFLVEFDNTTDLQLSTIGVIETEPVTSNIEIFWETTSSGLITDIVVDSVEEVEYYNTYWNKRLSTGMTDTTSKTPVQSCIDTATWPGPVSFFDAITGELKQNNDTSFYTPPPWPPNFSEEASLNEGLYRNASALESVNRNLYIEESRIFGGFNNDSTRYGVRAYLNEEESIQQRRFNSLIYSGIYNSRTGVNNTNVFSVGEDITRSVDPAYRSIQKLYAEDTNLIVLQEDKVSRALIDKDAIYSAEGGGTVTSSNAVIGQIVPYLGEFGISTNPESFAIFGFQKYFVDKQKGAVLRLSRDGLTEINNYGMRDFFRDQLGSLNNNAKIVGGYDIHSRQYVVSIQNQDGSYNTLSFDEDVKGWTSRYSYKPNWIFSLNNNFLSIKDSDYTLYQHYSDSVFRCNFYGVNNEANIVLLINEKPSLVKNYNTVNYEGSNGWEVDYFKSDIEGLDEVNGSWVENQDVTSSIKSYDEGKYSDGGVIYRAGFNRKENRYVANLINASTRRPGEVIFGDTMSGVKGYFATVKMSTDATTNPGGPKELFSVGSNVVVSSK